MNHHPTSHCACGHMFAEHATEGACHGCKACLSDSQCIVHGSYIRCGCKVFESKQEDSNART